MAPWVFFSDITHIYSSITSTFQNSLQIQVSGPLFHHILLNLVYSQKSPAVISALSKKDRKLYLDYSVVVGILSSRMRSKFTSDCFSKLYRGRTTASRDTQQTS